MAKIRRPRKMPRITNISQPRPYIKEHTVNRQYAEEQRAQVQLRKYIDRAQYTEARELFSEMVKTSRYPLEKVWKVGVEIISKTTPNDLADYLKAVYVGSSETLAPTTFNAYVDQLMIEKQWTLAFEEMELLYPRQVFHHPILLRKMAVCAFNQWKEAKEKLPKTYFQDDEHDPYDFSITRYEKATRLASKYLAEAHNTYKLDVVLLDNYLTFLEIAKDKSKHDVVLISLKAINENPEYFMLSYLLKINKQDQYFKSKPYILHLYECDPTLKPDEKLVEYIEKTCARIEYLKFKKRNNSEEMSKLEKRAQRICQIFTAQIANNNTDAGFIKLINEYVFEKAINNAICNIYRSSSADQLLKLSQDEKIINLALIIKKNIKRQLQKDESDEDKEEDKNKVRSECRQEYNNEDNVIEIEDNVIEIEDNVIENEDNVIDNEVNVIDNEVNVIDEEDDVVDNEDEEDDIIESEDEVDENDDDDLHDDIPQQTEISLFQRYLKHPLFNDDLNKKLQNKTNVFK